MLKYAVQYTDRAEKALKQLDKKAADLVRRRVDWLAEHADDIDHYALSGQWKGMFRFRVGDYRVIYELDRGILVVLVIDIQHRRKDYRRDG